MNRVMVHSANLSTELLVKINQTLSCDLNKNHRCYFGETTKNLLAVKSLSNKLKIDINIVPPDFSGTTIKLIVSDMDSTLINIECIDEIADFAGLKPQVAEITELAMLGRLDFNQSLIKRVKLLNGLPVNALDKVYQKKLQLNNGVENLIKTSKKMGIKFALVSGGFDFFTNKLHNKLKLDFSLSNKLEITNQKLTGKVTGTIINANEKAKFLSELCKKLNIKPSQTIAVGDGANDLLMMNIAGLSVAYHAKPTVQKQTDVQINYGGLDLVLDFI